LEGFSHLKKQKVGGGGEGWDLKDKSRNTAEECRAINRKPHRHF